MLVGNVYHLLAVRTYALCVCLSSAARERKHKQLMVGRWWSDGGRRVCVCVGEAMGEADGQGGGLATFKEKKKVLYFLF